jgi:tetratricopeptide (TPR) repeat protein
VGLQFHERTSGSVVPLSVLKMSSTARKEMRKSDDALLAGDVRGSAEHLQRMLALAPDLALGHNALGARYVALHEYDKAVEEFQKAVALEPNYWLAVDNLAVTMCLQHRYAEAEPAARWALQIQPEAPSSRYLLGSILVSEDKTTEEASRLLESVQDQYPRARLFLAKAYVAHADIEKAAEELRAYLASPQATDNGVAQEWLGRIEKELAAKRIRNAASID